MEAMTAAKEAGAIVSFDLNYRADCGHSSMPTIRKVLLRRRRPIVELCDVLVGNEEDLQKGLGIKARTLRRPVNSIRRPSSA